jgi:hypothetical protein
LTTIVSPSYRRRFVDGRLVTIHPGDEVDIELAQRLDLPVPEERPKTQPAKPKAEPPADWQPPSEEEKDE